MYLLERLILDRLFSIALKGRADCKVHKKKINFYFIILFPKIQETYLNQNHYYKWFSLRFKKSLSDYSMIYLHLFDVISNKIIREISYFKFNVLCVLYPVIFI